MADIAGPALGKGCLVKGILVGSKQLLQDLVTFFVNKEIRIPVHKIFGFSNDDQAALGYAKSGGQNRSIRDS